MDEASCRKAVKERSNGRCEMCGEHGTEMHHRKNRSQGGKWDTANIVHLCNACHRYVTVNPDNAKAEGFAVERHQEPEDVPILMVSMYSRAPMWLKLKRDTTVEFP